MQKVDKADEFIGKMEPVSVEELTRTKYYSDKLQKHEGYEIVMCTEGKCQFQIENKLYGLKKGDTVFIAEGEFHGTAIPGKCTCVFIQFRPHFIFGHPPLQNEFLLPFLSGLNGGSHKVSAAQKLNDCLRKLIRQWNKNKEDLAKIYPHLLTMIAIFKKADFITRSSPREKWRQKIRPALDLIYRQYAEPLQIGKMIQACALSRTDFFRLFRKTLNKTPIDLLYEVRLGQGANLLLFTERKISDVAYSVGFNNLSYFNRMFLKKYGVPPLRYRKTKSLKLPG